MPKKHVDDDEPKIIANINERNERAEIKFKRNISNAFQKRAILWIRAELRKSTNYLEAANRIKRKFDEKFGTEWTCLLGASAKERLGVFSHHRETTSILNVLFPRSGLRIVLFKQQSGSFSSKEAKSACEVKEVGFLCLFCGVLLGFIIAFVLSCGIVDTRVRNNKKVRSLLIISEFIFKFTIIIQYFEFIFHFHPIFSYIFGQVFLALAALINFANAYIAQLQAITLRISDI